MTEYEQQGQAEAQRVWVSFYLIFTPLSMALVWALFEVSAV